MIVKSSALRRVTCAAILLFTGGTQTANAAVSHRISHGESLWSIAHRDGLTVSELALANGLSANTHLIAGRVLSIPGARTAGRGSLADHTVVAVRHPVALRHPVTVHHPVAVRSTVIARRASAVDRDGDSDATGVVRAGAGPSPLGGYTIRPGDTLGALARHSRVSVGEIAFMNGLDPRRPIRAGTIIKLPTGAPVPARAREAIRVRQVVPGAGPYPTPSRVSEGEVRSIAAAHGVPSSLAAAIAWQESGFNNGLVSSANARGVMQLLPGTWDWVQRRLVGHALDPRSPRDNIKAGVMYLHSLMRSTGNNPSTTAAAYYQGLGSVRRIGLLPDTRRYVASVRTLMNRFGGR